MNEHEDVEAAPAAVGGHHPRYFAVHRFFSDTAAIDELLAKGVPHATILNLYPQDLAEYAATLSALRQRPADFARFYELAITYASAVQTAVWYFAGEDSAAGQQLAEFVTLNQVLAFHAAEETTATEPYDELALVRTVFYAARLLNHWAPSTAMRTIPWQQRRLIAEYLRELEAFCEDEAA